ncbi:prenyltransferase [Nocardia sp. BSTN01]|uniref:aromatic prenyltransferase n=1 Tax=Nocardia sp. BSTN01 TaxID=2783665 RepID=UPI00188ECEB8|nr:aromatic prenyltransferase [Nocardia sp. BSTN01]MBF4996467.1 prenyltransferase [Nocardia sp. BSTN01]
MSTTTESALDDLYVAIEKSARLANVPCTRDAVSPVLTAFGTMLTQSVISFRVVTEARRAGDLDYRFLTLPNDIDPYDIARSNGLLPQTDHPIGSLLDQVRKHCPVDSYGIDIGVAGGFKKIWPFFPTDAVQNVTELAALPSMPAGLADHIDMFARHGLADKVGLLGIDYHDKTMNVYFPGLPAEHFAPEAVAALHRDAGFPEPSAQFLALTAKAFDIYATFGWESSRIERLCFPVITPDPGTLPIPIEPRFRELADKAPFATNDRRFTFAATSSPAGESYKFSWFYQWQPRILDKMKTSDSQPSDS